jgi:hypothetical protein
MEKVQPSWRNICIVVLGEDATEIRFVGEEREWRLLGCTFGGVSIDVV